METDAGTFDPFAYKRTTREQWQDVAGAWDAWGPTLETWLGPATELMLDLAEVGPGAHVLDVAAGAGGQTLAAAKRVGPSGAVLATDIAPAILEYASANARRAGLSNVTTKALDGEHLDVAPSAFDAVISRLGLIYFPDQDGSLAQMCRAVRPGGRVAAIVYSTPDRNEFFSVPVSIVREHAKLPPPLPGQPGPFSLGAPGAIEALLERAGLTDVVARRVDAPLEMASAAEYVRFARQSFGALHQMLAGLALDAREQAWSDIELKLKHFEGPHGFIGPCELIVAAGRR